MPKFVPVVDTEKPIAEQNANDPDYGKHRKFDAPHALHRDTNQVDRGWQQGSLGWGVLGSFGSNGKDDGAQVIRRSDGAAKMVKNEKGLWVKAKSLDCDGTMQGRGRGGGVPVFSEPMFGSSVDNAASAFDDPDDYKPRRSTKSDHSRHENSSQDRYKESSRSRRRSRSRDSRDRRRDSRDRRRDSRDRRDSRRNRSRSSKRGTDRDRRRGRSYSNDRRRERKYSRDRHDKYDDRKMRTRDYSRSTSPEQSEHSSKEEEMKKADEVVDADTEMPTITAVQIVNRLHEVYSTETLFHKDRLDNILELFESDACIGSLKTGKIYIDSAQKVRDSFDKTKATNVVTSKRVYICINENSSTVVTFCLDFHRAGTSPGLGDKSKDSVLLYQCEKAKIRNIWGMIDNEKLSSSKDLSEKTLFKSLAWSKAMEYIVKCLPDFQIENHAHYHNYDEMEVWG